MLKNIAKYSATACLVSVVVLNSAAIAETVMNKQMVSEVASKVTATQTTSSTKVAESSLNAQAKPFIPVQVKHETLMKRDVVAEKQVAMKEVKQSETKIIEHELKSSTALNSTDSKLAEKKAKHDVKAVEKKIEAEHKAVAKQETVMKRDMAAEMNVKPFVSMHKSEHKEKVEAKSMMPAFFADSKWMGDGKNYFKVKAGVAQALKLSGNTKIDSKPDATFVAGVTVGRELMDGVSIDCEYSHRSESKVHSNDVSVSNNIAIIKSRDWKVKSNTIFANMNLNLTNNSQIIPYLRAGLGVSRNTPGTMSITINSDNSTINAKTTNALAWQAGLGMSFAYGSMIDTELEYMFINRGSVKTVDTEAQHEQYGDVFESGMGVSAKLRDQVITLGIKFKF